MCLRGDGVSSSVKAGSSQRGRTQGSRSLNIHHGMEMGSCVSWQTQFVCSLHPSDLPSITTPEAICGRGVVREQDQPAQFAPFLQTPLAPTASITLPKAAGWLLPTPRAEATAKPGRVRGGNGGKLCGIPSPGTRAVLRSAGQSPSCTHRRRRAPALQRGERAASTGLCREP